MIALCKIINSGCYISLEALLPFKVSSVLFRNTSVIPRCGYRFYCDKEDKDTNSSFETPHDSDTTIIKPQKGLDSKYKIFQDADAPILLDVYEEKSQLEQRSIIDNEEENDKFYGINLERK